jgi:hypothetical protein
MGALGLVSLVLLVPAPLAATPAPDPPPLAVAPEAPNQPPVQSTQAPVERAPVVTRTVVTQAPVVTRTVVTPIIVTREVPVRPAAAPAKKQQAKAAPKPKPKPARKAATKPKPATVLPAARPHDRSPVPLARFVPSAEELNRGLVALAGAGLAFVALGGAVLLLAARRQFGELAR